MNKIFLTGNLTKDPDIRYTQSGKCVCRTSIAVNRRFSKENEADFFNLIAWEKTAELFGKYLHKGSKIFVEGRVQNNNYEKEGVKYYGNDVIVESIEFMDSGNKKAVSGYSGEPVPDDDVPF